MLRRIFTLFFTAILLTSTAFAPHYIYAIDSDDSYEEQINLASETPNTDFQVKLLSGLPFDNQNAKLEFEQNNFPINFSRSTDNLWEGSFHYGDSDTPTPYHIYQAILSPKNGALDEDGTVINRNITNPTFVFSSNVPFMTQMPIFITGKTLSGDTFTTATIAKNLNSTAVFDIAADGTYTLKLELPDCDIYEYNIFFAVGGVNTSSDDFVMTEDTVSNVTYAYSDSSSFFAQLVNQEQTATGRFVPSTAEGEEDLDDVNAVSTMTPYSTGTLTVQKKVMGAYADLEQTFDFWVIISPTSGVAVDLINNGDFPASLDFRIYNADNTQASNGIYNPTENGGFSLFKLSHNQRLVIDLPTGDFNYRDVLYRVVEPETPSLYEFAQLEINGVIATPKLDYVFGTIFGPATELQQINFPNSASVVFTNKRINEPVPTALTISDTPFIVMCVLPILLGGAYSMYIRSKKATA